jgi:hypothetical protein
LPGEEHLQDQHGPVKIAISTAVTRWLSQSRKP